MLASNRGPWTPFPLRKSGSFSLGLGSSISSSTIIKISFISGVSPFVSTFGCWDWVGSSMLFSSDWFAFSSGTDCFRISSINLLGPWAFSWFSSRRALGLYCIFIIIFRWLLGHDLFSSAWVISSDSFSTCLSLSSWKSFDEVSWMISFWDCCSEEISNTTWSDSCFFSFFSSSRALGSDWVISTSSILGLEEETTICSLAGDGTRISSETLGCGEN